MFSTSSGGGFLSRILEDFAFPDSTKFLAFLEGLSQRVR